MTTDTFLDLPRYNLNNHERDTLLQLQRSALYIVPQEGKDEGKEVLSFWYYGKSRVIIKNGQVVEWDDNGDLKLEKISNDLTFELGSTTDELKRVMGNPNKVSGNYDGNYIVINPQIPNWVFEKFALPFKYGFRHIFLKNKGLHNRHIDVFRQCSLTILLNDVHAQTDFYEKENDNIVATLLHNGNTFLQNSQVPHFVEPTKYWRYFFQISFTQSFEEMKEKLK